MRSSASACATVRGKPSRMKPFLRVRLLDAVGDDADDDRRPRRARRDSMIALAWRPTGVPAATAARSMSPVESCGMPCCSTRRCRLRALARPPAARAGSSLIRRLSPVAAWPELGLLHEALVLVRQQMAVDLRHRVHRHATRRSAARCRRNRTAARHRRPGVSGKQADDGQIGRADHRDAGQHVVDVVGRALARTDAGNEAAMLLQIVGRLRRVEDDRRVEEGEEDDQRGVERACRAAGRGRDRP